MKKLLLLLSFVSLLFLSKTALCQQIIDTPITNLILPPTVIKTFPVNGRVLGFNLEFLRGVIVTNSRTKEKTNTDSRGIFHMDVSKEDTLTFEIANHSKETRTVKSAKDHINVIMIRRKVDELPPNALLSTIDAAAEADDKFYRILEKDAKLEGKWKY
jgi:hypothetical protein